MGKIVRFPKASSAPRAGELDAGQIKAVSLPRVSLVGILAWVWLIMRLPLFLVLYWLRLPVVFVCNLISIPMMIVFLFSLYAFPDKHAMIWGFGVLSFAAFVIEWIYDYVLMWLSPQPIMRTL